MDLENKFQEAVKNSKNISQKPTNKELLNLYALYKQSTEGNVTGERPEGFDFKGAAKFDAWSEIKGAEKSTCMQEYIDLVESLLSKYNG